jgi:hypothetical protein
MSPDSKYALGALGVLLLTISLRQFSFGLLEFLLMLTRPGATVLLLGILVFLYSKKLLWTALASSLVVAYLLKDVWTAWPRSDARRLHLEIGRDLARFNPSNSIDLQFADKSVVHSEPEMLNRAFDPKMLVFPPSDQVLRDMNGE